MIGELILFPLREGCFKWNMPLRPSRLDKTSIQVLLSYYYELVIKSLTFFKVRLNRNRLTNSRGSCFGSRKKGQFSSHYHFKH